MSKSIEKTPTKSLVHKPCDVLELFGNYDATNRGWVRFDDSLSAQIRELEEKNQQYIRVSAGSNRRSFR